MHLGKRLRPDSRASRPAVRATRREDVQEHRATCSYLRDHRRGRAGTCAGAVARGPQGQDRGRRDGNRLRGRDQRHRLRALPRPGFACREGRPELGRFAARAFFFSSRRRHTRWTGDWSSDVCSSDLMQTPSREETDYCSETDTEDIATHGGTAPVFVKRASTTSIVTDWVDIEVEIEAW